MADNVLEPEFAIWYTLAWIVLIARMIARLLLKGSWRGLQVDDLLVVLAMVTATILGAVMHEVVTSRTNLIAPGDNVTSFTPVEIQHRIYGSKLVLVVEQMQLTTIWLIKTCLLIFYYRATKLLPQRKLVYLAAFYVAMSFAVMQALYFAVWCRPFSQYWAVPTHSTQCSAATNHLLTNAVLNITSDLVILYIPIPILLKVRLPVRKKIMLGGIIGIGLASIASAALNKYYSFRHPYGNEWTIWYLREAYTAILCANFINTYPLLRRIWGMQKSFFGEFIESHQSTRIRSFGVGEPVQIEMERISNVQSNAEGDAPNNPSPVASIDELERIVGMKEERPLSPLASQFKGLREDLEYGGR